MVGGGGGLTERHDFTGTKKYQGLRYSSYDQRLYYGTSNDAGDGDGEIGYFLAGSWSPNALAGTSTAYVRDLAVFAEGNRIWTLEGDGDIHERALDGTELSTISQVSNPITAVSYAEAISYLLWEESDGSVYARPIASAGIVTYMPPAPPIQIVDGTSLTSGANKGMDGHNGQNRLYQTLSIAAADHAVRFEAGTYGQTTYDKDLGDLGEAISSMSLASIGVSPELAQPVLTVGTETATTVPLSWTNLTGETEYVLQRADDDGAGAPDLTTLTTEDTFAADVTSDTRTGETPETISWWRIRGGNVAPGPWSDWKQATTTAVTDRLFIAVQDSVKRRPDHRT